MLICALLSTGCALSPQATVTPTNTRVARQSTATPLPPTATASTTPRPPTPSPLPTSTAPPTVTARPLLPTPTSSLSLSAQAIPPLTLRQMPAMALKEWPRPAQDNGLGIHFLPAQYAEDKDLDYGISWMKKMGLRWTLVVYSDEMYLAKVAPKFKDAGIMVVWRKMLRAYEPYYGWERDIVLLKSLGLPPYMQVYNEPELGAEWDGRPISSTLFLENLVQASRDIYNAGGYVGWQFIKPDWLQDAINAVKARQGEAIFGRMFFVPHPYGLNHPPDYEQDLNGVLSFLRFADVFSKEIGFVPPMIAGEGGWKFKADDDKRFPPIDDARHRDYHVAVFNWFRTGKLSNGQSLPDYMLSFCPWLLLGGDAAAWLNSMDGTRTATIDAVTSMSAFVRRFSWDR